MKIHNLLLRQVFDSRAEATLEVELVSSDQRSFRAQVPSGKSRGRRETVVLEFPDAERFLQKNIKPALLGKAFATIAELDQALLALDGTETKERIGGNLALGISIAFMRALAFEQNKEIWEILNEEFFETNDLKQKPFIFSNLIEGGAHVHQSSLAIQEYLVVAKPAQTFQKTIQELIALYRDLEETLRRFSGLNNLSIGDEGGFALDFKDNLEPLRILRERIEARGLEQEFGLGMDAAASNFYENGVYEFDGKQMSRRDLLEIYRKYVQDLKILFTIEDPFDEDDVEGFRRLRQELPEVWVIGDDLTVSHTRSITKCVDGGLINAVIVKPNQVGTVTETCRALEVAKQKNIRRIVSHRSGETEDDFIIHLAKASGAEGVKIGAPIRERLFEFNALLRLYDGRVD